MIILLFFKFGSWCFFLNINLKWFIEETEVSLAPPAASFLLGESASSDSSLVSGPPRSSLISGAARSNLEAECPDPPLENLVR